MSLFCDLRQMKTAFNSLSEMVDKISFDTLRKNSMYKRPQHLIYGNNHFSRPMPSLGLGVRFSQSHEDVNRLKPSSNFSQSHMSLPNLDKDETIDNSNNAHRLPNEKNNIEQGSVLELGTNINKENIYEWILATKWKYPHFDDQGSTHPVEFLEEVKYCISEFEIPANKTLPFILACLGGVPLLWARCFRNEFSGDINKFYKMFIEEFWGLERQKSILYDMKLGKYEPTEACSTMSEYFLHKVWNYRYLTPPPSDLEIVYSLAAHFPSAVELELRLSSKPSLREAYGILRRREGETTDYVPNYLFDMCETFQRSVRPESAHHNAQIKTFP